VTKRGNARYGPVARGIRRDLSEKGWVPARYWTLWFVLLAPALLLFYVLLTPVWVGLRAAAWVSDKRRQAGSSR
jgi:hypothetical protein